MSEIIKYDVSEELSQLNDLVKEYGGVDSYTTTQATTLFELICKMVSIFLFRIMLANLMAFYLVQ